METLSSYCLALLRSDTLEAKLFPPRQQDGSRLPDPPAACPLWIDAPGRPAAWAMCKGSDRLPKLAALHDPAARARCLARFAHHELCAVELFAWALLAFPDAPPALRRGFVGALEEEQEHLRLYLGRLAALGDAGPMPPHADYLWQQASRIRESEHPLASFLCAMGLTLEQANLDYTLLYRDAFRSAGDEEGAQVLQRVHDDEIRHVALAAHWLPRVAPDVGDEVERYTRHVPFPLSPVRAKARRFDVAARRRAGLGDAFIAHIRDARPTHQVS